MAPTTVRSGYPDAAAAKKEVTPDSEITVESEDGWQREVKRTADIMLARSITIDEIDADGNCLFRAASRLLNLDELDHMNVRGRCLRLMRSHAQDFAPFVPDDGEGPDEEADEDKVYRYTQSMNRPGAWGGDLEIKALAGVYKTGFLVHQADSADPLEFGDVGKGDNPFASLVFYPTHHAGAHYNVGSFVEHGAESLPTYQQAKGYLFEANQKEKERKRLEAEAEEKRKHESRFTVLAGPKKLAAPKTKKKKSAFG